ncbi:regulatory protein, luxR family [Catalinimonas alkaloidigena]|uniref:Regulatory protein, luxR family n=1 Tax=Catalinimonas alkaloidigena TaxID=1075417 RepID=A0A1G9N966_9BACT|nr:PAS domain-containing protein [Catalinimonas alkaloidigena]SDL82950.1 regulatory protein, luxR family [Catalinimonas alkaloidigena]
MHSPMSMPQVPVSASPKPASAQFDRLVRQWQSRPYAAGPDAFDFHEWLHNDPVLRLFLTQSPCLTWVLDMRTLQYDFISQNVEEMLGYEAEAFQKGGVAFTMSLLHPDDFPKLTALMQRLWDYLLAQPASALATYQLSGDYRIRKADGGYIRLLEQNSILQVDRNGQITHLLGMGSDITSWKKDHNLFASVHSTELNKCLQCTSEDPQLKECQQLSVREREIVELMSHGHNSKQIADRLSISFHTVNTHRQKMLEKTHTRNSGGLIQFAIRHGII